MVQQSAGLKSYPSRRPRIEGNAFLLQNLALLSLSFCHWKSPYNNNKNVKSFDAQIVSNNGPSTKRVAGYETDQLTFGLHNDGKEGFEDLQRIKLSQYSLSNFLNPPPGHQVLYCTLKENGCCNCDLVFATNTLYKYMTIDLICFIYWPFALFIVRQNTIKKPVSNHLFLLEFIQIGFLILVSR